MVPADVIQRFAGELARRHGRRAVSERDLRCSISGYAKCYAIAHGLAPQIPERQMDRALAHYRKTRALGDRQLALLPAAV